MRASFTNRQSNMTNDVSQLVMASMSGKGQCSQLSCFENSQFSFRKRAIQICTLRNQLVIFLTVFGNAIGYFQHVRVGNTDKGRKRRLAVPFLEVELNSLIWCMQSKKKTTQMTTRRLIPLWCHWPWSVQLSVANCFPKNNKNWPRTG